MTLIVYKALDRDGRSPYQKFKWPTPKGKKAGTWVEVKDRPVLCRVGLHGFLRLEDAERAGAVVYEMELAGEIVKDGEKAAGQRARLLRQLFAFGPEGPIQRGVRRCETCGKPHDSYKVAKGLAPQWSDLNDGHSYAPESWDDHARRQENARKRIEAYRLARLDAKKDHTGTGIYDPVVPAFHGPFKEWPEKPDRCGTCGLDRSLHRGWKDRQKLSDEFAGYDRWDLMLLIQELRTA